MDLRSRLQLLADTLPESGAVTFTRADLLTMLAGEGGIPTNTDERGAGEDYTVKDIADKERRSPNTVRTWIRTGELRAYLLNDRDYRVSVADYVAFKERKRTEGEGKRRVKRGKTAAQRKRADLGNWREKLRKVG